MQRVFIPNAVMAMLLAAGMGAAQTTFNRPPSSGLADPYESGLRIYNRTWADLNNAQKSAVPNPGDWYRFDQARGQMDLLARTWQDGSFTKAQLYDAIDQLQFVLSQNHILDRDRRVLQQDLNQLRDIRLRFGG